MDKNRSNKTDINTSKYKSPEDMCLMDDAMMNLVFDDCPEAIQEVLKIILEKDDLIIKESKTQNQLGTGINKKTVRLDVLATDSSGSLYDIELQNTRDPALLNRIIYYSSLLNLKSLDRGDEYLNTRHSFVIFICDFDCFNAGLSMYHISRNIKELPNVTIKHTDEIIIVNGTYQKEDQMGLLMRDFHKGRVNDINNKILKERLSYFKETKEGQSCMSEYIQRVYKDDIEAAAKMAAEKEKLRTTFRCATSLAKSLNMSVENILDGMGCEEELKAKILKKLANKSTAL